MSSAVLIGTRTNLLNARFICFTTRKNGSPRAGKKIRARIDEGYASAQRGDLMDAESVRAEMREKKRAWRANHRP
jgi:hypothetical protein